MLLVFFAQVLLCEETVSLLGIRQFYKLVGDAPTTSSSSRAAEASNCADVAGTDARHIAAQAADTLSAATVGEQTHAGHTGTSCGSPRQTTESAALQQQHQQPNGPAADADAELPKLSLAEQEQLLMLKVDALQQLLSSVSFHQVRKILPCMATCGSFVATKCSDSVAQGMLRLTKDDTKQCRCPCPLHSTHS